MQEVLIKMQYY